jgi:hypothetical protein
MVLRHTSNVVSTEHEGAVEREGEGKRVRARKGRGEREAYRGLPGTVLTHKHDHGFRVKLGVRKCRRIEGVIHVHLG